MSKAILFVVNSAEFFLSHRLPVALAAQKAGLEVHVATSGGVSVREIERWGLQHHTVPISRSRQNPLAELVTIFNLYQLFRRLKPNLVHLITIKPVLYGGIAARLSGGPSVVAAVSGLGTVFVAQSFAAGARRLLVSLLYRMAFRHRRLAVIFQNPDDRDALLGISALEKCEARMIRGSGVSLDDYSYKSEPEGVPIVVMASRLLRDKGVYEFVEAARLLKARHVPVLMRLIGAPDPGNPTSVSEADLNGWFLEGVVELLGYREDVAQQYEAANIVCLPSYREGLPKGLVEAAACGRAVVTTDVPGCRDAIEPGVTGVLVPVKSATALADAIQMLIEDPESRFRMGMAGRKLAEEAFSIDRITEQHLEIYEELLADD